MLSDIKNKFLKNFKLSNLFIKFTFFIFLIIFPIVSPQGFISVGFIAIEYSIFALGLNIVVGWTGLLDLGSAGFVAVGSYVTAIFLTQFGLPALIVLPLTFIFGFLTGILLGIPTLRHRSDYFAILTLGFAELVSLAIRNWPSITKGAYGFSGIPAISLPFLDEPFKAVPPIKFYYFALAVLFPSYFILKKIRSSKLGRFFHVVKNSQETSASYGINIILTKIIAFGLSASIISVGGFFWASYQRSIVWSEFGVLLSCMLLSLLIVGGIGNPKGVILGGIIVGSSLEILRVILTSLGFPQNIRFLVFASLLVLFIHIKPRGLIPDQPTWLSKYTKSSKDSSHLIKSQSIEMSSPKLLRVENVTKKYDGVIALKNLSFNIDHRECVALIGPNGSGKTTLLNIISGFRRPFEGIIRFNEGVINKYPAFRIARLGIGRSFQDISIFDDLNVQDNVFIVSKNVDYKNVKKVLNKFGFHNGTLPCSSLSYGEKKILDLARLFAEPTRYKLVLLDEPTAGLSQKEAQYLVSLLHSLKEETGLAMVIVSHDILFLEALNVDRVIVLDQGQLFKEGTFEFIQSAPSVRKLFWGEGIV